MVAPMAITDGHFKAPVNIRPTGEPSAVPIELMFVAGGVLVIFVICAFVYWRRINASENMAGS